MRSPLDVTEASDRLPSMRRRSAPIRLLLGLMALIQLVTPGLAATADAHLVREATWLGAGAHIESHTRPNCPPVHDVDCALCQHLAHAAARPARPVAPPLVVCVAPPEHLPIVSASSAPDDPDSRPRAPPRS